MGRRHLTAEEIKNNLRVQAIIDQEYRRQRSTWGLPEQVEQAIHATHTACMTLQLIVLIDHFEADKEWCVEFMKLQRELLEQYNDGTVQLKQMQEHIKLRTGIDVTEYTKSIMHWAGISKGGEADERKTLPDADKTSGSEDTDSV